MNDSFNPYLEWLGISGGKGRPNHYELLGVPPFEADSRAIVDAAERRTAAVFGIQAGSRVADWQRVLSELAEAKKILSDAADKWRYDEELRRELQARGLTSPSKPMLRNEVGRNILPPKAASLNPLPPRGTEGGRETESAAPDATVDPMAPVSFPKSAEHDPMAPVVMDAHMPNEEVAPPRHAQAAPASIEEGMLAPSLPPRAAISLSARRRQNRQHFIGAVCLLLLGAGIAAGIGFVTGVLRLEGDREISQTNQNGNEDSKSETTEPAKEGLRQKPAEENIVVPDRQTNSMANKAVPVANGSATANREEAAPSNAESMVTQAKTLAPANDSPPPDTGPADPVKARRLKLALANTRLTLGKREWEEARRHLDEASQSVSTADDQALVDAMRRVEQHVAGFWQAVAEGVKNASETGELQVGSTFVSIVETGSDYILIRAAGENRRYTMKQIPSGLAMALANRWFDTKPDNDVLRGAFMFVDPKGGADEARRLWQQAGQQEPSLSVDALLKLLPLAEIETVGGVAVVKGPVPETADVEQAEKQIRGKRAAELASATTSSKKLELAKALIDSAKQGEAEPAARFASLKIARDLAAEANQPSVAIEAAELLTKWFEVDSIKTRLQTLERLKPANPAAAKAIAQAGLALLEEASRGNQAEAAKRAGQLTVAAAQKSQSVDLVKQARERVAKLNSNK